MRRSCPSGFSSTTRDRGVTTAVLAKLPANHRKQIRCGGEEEYADEAVAALEQRRERRVVRFRRRIQLEIAEQAAECRPVRGVEFLAEKFAAGGFRLGQVFDSRQRRAGDAENARFRGHLPGRIAAVQRRQQFARHQVPGAAEKQHVESRKYRHRSRIPVYSASRCNLAVGATPSSRVFANVARMRHVRRNYRKCTISRARSHGADPRAQPRGPRRLSGAHGCRAPARFGARGAVVHQSCAWICRLRRGQRGAEAHALAQCGHRVGLQRHAVRAPAAWSATRR